MDLMARFKNSVGLNQWFEPSDKVLLAVSGGVDSMVLLYLMQQLPEEMRPIIGVSHINHQLRDISDEEEQFLEEYCIKRGIPFFVNTWAEGPSIKTHVEQKARDFRYHNFNNVMDQHQYTVLLTAHHKGDQVETMLMRLVNGSGLKTLIGIEEVRPFKGKQLVRPLLKIEKAELYDFAANQSIPFYEDETNQTDSYARNRIRREIIPRLEQENSQFTEHMLHFRHELRLANQVVEKQTSRLFNETFQKTTQGWELKRDIFFMYDESERYFLLEKLSDVLREEEQLILSRQAKAEIMDRIMNHHPNQYLALPSNWVLERSYEKVKIYPKKEDFGDVSFSHSLLVNEGLYLNECEWIGYVKGKEEMTPESVKNWHRHEMLLKQEMPESLVIRKRRPGDRFVYNDLGQTKKVSRYFIDQKIPTEKREKSWVVTDKENNVIWLVPFRETYLSIRNETDKIQYKLVYYYR